MLEKGFIKPGLSKTRIGHQQFWVGILLGCIFSLGLYLLFGMSREAFRFISILNDLVILNDVHYLIYDLFFAGLSTSLGISVTIIYWFIGRKISLKKRYLKTFAVSNTIFVSLITFVTVSRFGSNLAIVPNSFIGYDNQLSIATDLWPLLLLLPVYVFFNSWNIVILLFKAQAWMLVTVLLWLAISSLLFLLVNIDRSLLNQAYERFNRDSFTYIDTELARSQCFDVAISDSLRDVLRKKNSYRNYYLLKELRKKFNNGKQVTTEEIILEKIMVHNLHSLMEWTTANEDKDQNWPYAMPDKIYSQILKEDVDSDRALLLFEVLAEQASIINMKDIQYEEYYTYSKYQRKKSSFARHILSNTSTVQSRLNHVVRKLKTDPKYLKFQPLMDTIEIKDLRRNQIEINLELK